MQIALSQPITATAQQTVEVSAEAVTVDFVYADFLGERITIKIQPLNREVHITGEAFAAIRDAFSAPLAEAFAPAIAAAVNPAPAPEE